MTQTYFVRNNFGVIQNIAFQLYVVSGVDMFQSILIAYFAIRFKKLVKA